MDNSEASWCKSLLNFKQKTYRITLLFYHFIHTVAIEWLAIRLYIHVDPGSNPGPDTGYGDLHFSQSFYTFQIIT
jgi:hypothetical protein